MDDRRGVAVARSQGLEATGTLGVLARAVARTLVDLPQAVQRLKAPNFRCSPTLLDALLARGRDIEADHEPRADPPRPNQAHPSPRRPLLRARQPRHRRRRLLLAPLRVPTLSTHAHLLPSQLGLDRRAEGLIAYDVFGSIYNPGKVLLLTSWQSADLAERWKPKSFAGAAKLRHRRMRAIRDYGMFDRREAPQYYPPAT